MWIFGDQLREINHVDFIVVLVHFDLKLIIFYKLKAPDVVIANVFPRKMVDLNVKLFIYRLFGVYLDEYFIVDNKYILCSE